MIDILNQPEFYGYIAAILTTVAFLPQLIKTYKTKSAEDVSIVMLLMFILGLIFWIVYGIKSKALPVVIANFITLFLQILFLLSIHS